MKLALVYSKKIFSIVSVAAILFLASVCPVFASRGFIGVGGGYATYSESYKNSMTTVIKASLIADPGFSIDADFGLSPIEYKDSEENMKLKSAMGGVSYHIQRGGQTTPYVGISAGITNSDGVFDSPKIAYGIKAGVTYALYQDMSLFLEYEERIMKDSFSDDAFRAHCVTAGFSIKLFGQDPPQKFNDISAEQRLKEYRRNLQNY